MATAVVMMEQDLSVADIDTENVRCPQCGSTTFVLRGNSQAERTEVWENGKRMDATVDPETHCFEVEQIDCLVCNNRTNLIPDRFYQMQSVFFSLRKLIMDLGGEDPLGLGKPS